ncbi:hypothetical protein LUZ60_006368 [Juncus effusus]|nr:hypothetical protein LUZ60_006368 [Juncus effusus]
MEGGDSGKLFIGGISWDTNEDQLTEYFGQFGEVAEAVIMRDRVTGRARGFGFIVFADSAVAERVILEKHMIDGRLVEAKKAVPRDDQSAMGSRTANSILSSPSPGPSARTRKIFVGGLPSSITEPDFKLYFEQFGPISDVVVMYDHTTQRPRGFGFITFDNDESVDRALAKNTFHELNGKMVEVKRAVPKELSPGPARSPTPAGGVGRVSMNSSLLNFYGGYGGGSPGPVGRYGGGGGGLNSSSIGGRNGLFAGYGGIDGGFGSGSGLGFNRGPGMYMASRYGTGSGLSPTGGYGLGLNDDSRLGFARNNNLWGNGTGINTGTGTGLNPNLYSNMNMNMNMNMSMNMSNSSMVRSLGPFNNGGSGGNNLNWTGPVGGEMEGGNNNSFGLYGRNETGNGSFDNGFGARNLNPDLYGGDPIYGGDKTWSFNTTELDGPIGPFNYMDNNNNYANNETSRGISS